MRTSFIGLAALASALIAAPAFAGDASCFWKAAPQSARDAILAKAKVATLTNDDLQAFTAALNLDKNGAACGLRNGNGEAVGAAIAGYVVETGTIAWLESRGVATRAQLDAGWNGMDPAIRAKVIANAAAMSKEGFPEETLPDFVGHMGLGTSDAASLTGSEAGGVIYTYIATRALVVANEPKF